MRRTDLIPACVKDVDLPLFEQAQEQLGDSVSSMFAEFLRERVATLTPEEGRILELVNEISRARENGKQGAELACVYRR